MTSHRLTALVVTALAAQLAMAQEKPELKDARQRASYAIGANIGADMKRQELDLDAKLIGAGLADAFAGKAAMTEAEIKMTLSTFSEEVTRKLRAKQAVAGAENLKKSEEFLAANAKKEGVKTTATGLQYKVVKSGTGAMPKRSDSVKVHYHGTLIDGTVFDSSVERGEPISFPVTGVIPGWTEALQLMKVGDKFQLYIPAKLAYGEDGAPPKIAPNSTLIFDVELLGIEK